MSLSIALVLWCVGGGIVGAFLKWIFPYLFKRKQKQDEFELINLGVALVIGATLGFGISIFFEADLINSDAIAYSYIKKLGLLTAIFTFSTIDRIDKYGAKISNKFFDKS